MGGKGNRGEYLATLAVLDGRAGALYVSTAPTEPRPVTLAGDAPSLIALCEACGHRGVSQLWIVGADPAAFDYERDQWGGWNLQPAAPAPWIHAVKAHSPFQVDIVFPALMVESRTSRKEVWRKCADPVVLLNALITFRALLHGQAWHRSSGATAARLLRRLHSGPHTLPLEMPEGDWPAPALAPNTETLLEWYRALTPREANECRYIHAYDKNGAFLGACSSLAVGAGALEHTDVVTLEDRRRAGYVLCDVPADSPHIPAFIPRTRKGMAHIWVSMPTWSYMVERGEPARVWEAYLWRDTHRPLEPWYKVLRDARITLMHEGDDPAAQLALRAVKGVYASFTGGYLASTRWDRSTDTLYRPDVRHSIIATARINLIRKAEKVYAAHGIAPVAIGGVDTLFYASPDPWPVRFAATLAPEFTLGETLREFKEKGTAPLTPAIRDALGGAEKPGTVLAALFGSITTQGVPQ